MRFFTLHTATRTLPKLAMLLLFLNLAILAGAQSGYTVKGVVIDSAKGSILELATVQLKSPGATTPEYVQLSDLDGHFLFDHVKAGTYELAVSSVGYLPLSLPVNVTQNTDVSSVKLSASSQALKEATIVAEKPVIVKTSEKTVFNVAQSPTHQTGTAEDALRNMPGVSVDRNGNISMIGKQGVKVLVDGKPSILAESNLQAFLKSIPANTIESIELITNPSARYDANGNAGIINIKLKKGKRDGLNGSVSVNGGYPARGGGNALINYRKNKWNLFANYSADYRDVAHLFTDKRDINISDTLSHYYMNNPSQEQNLSNSLKAGFDFFADDKNTITYTFSGSHESNHFDASANSQSSNADFNLLNTYISATNNRDINISITNDINYLKKYDSTERELMVDLSHTYVDANQNSILHSKSYDAAGIEMPAQNLIRNMISKNHINNIIFMLNYSEPLKWKGHKLETGIKNETTLNQNRYDVYDKQNGTDVQNMLLSNGFDYLENIAAFYVIYNGAHKDWLSYSAGLRTEHTFINSNKSDVSRNYLSFFPSATLSANLNKKNNLSLSYSRRVQRPEFRQINNSVIYFDQYSTWEGNPYLTPAFSNIISLAYTYTAKKVMLSVTSENSFTTGQFSESSGVDSNRITRGGIRNGGDSRTIGGSLYIKADPTKWLSFQMNHYVAWQQFDYKAGVNTGAVARTYYNLWASIDFKFWKNTVLNVNGWYNTGDVFAQGTSRPCGMVNASIKKDFFKDRFTVSVLFQNMANTMKFGWYVNNTSLHTNGSWQNFNRAVILTLTYRFGGEGQNVRHRDLEENSRLGGGGKGK